MKILRTMKPGAKGTQALSEEFGASLVCVRYRYDAGEKKRYTTAEIIVAEGDWDPASHEVEAGRPTWVRIRWDEEELRARVKEAGGRWDAEKRLWALAPGKVRQLHLEGRVASTDARTPKPASRSPRGV